MTSAAGKVETTWSRMAALGLASLCLCLAALSGCDDAPACSGERVGAFCVPQSTMACADEGYPRAFHFADGLVCGAEDADVSTIIEALCTQAGVACQGTPALCPDSVATLGECTTVTTTYADCGGDGGPVFACAPGGCRWFTGGCAPLDHVVSTCPASDLCCHADWPWTPDMVPNGYGTTRFIHAFGFDPRGVGFALNVAVGPAPTALSEPGLECVGSLTGGNTPCQTAIAATEVNLPGGGRRITIAPTTGILFGFRILIELERADDAHARVCLEWVTDSYRFTCEDDGPPEHWGAPCATSGAVQFGEGGGYLSVQFDSGAQIEGWW